MADDARNPLGESEIDRILAQYSPPNPLYDHRSYLAEYLQRAGQDMRQRAERPNWGETRWVGPEGYNYLPLPAYDSNIGEFARNALTLGPLALGSRAGARAGNDAVWAHGVSRIPEATPHLHAEMPGMRHAGDPSPYYPARQDRPVPANNNLSPIARDQPLGPRPRQSAEDRALFSQLMSRAESQAPITPQQARARIAEIEKIRSDKVWSGEWTTRSPEFQALGDQIGQLMIHLHAPPVPPPRPNLGVIPGGRKD